MLRKIAIAAFTAVVLFYLIVFVQLGTIWVFQLANIELLMMFVFLLATFWLHEKLAQYFTQESESFYVKNKRIFEPLIVIGTSLLFTALIFFLPYFLWIPGADLNPKILRLMLVVNALLSLFFYYFIERERIIKKWKEVQLKREQIEKEMFRSELQLLKNQVDPHFLFNCLNILNALIKKEPKQALCFSNQLAAVYRLVLDNTDQLLVPLKNELELMQAYSSLLKTRFCDAVFFEFDIPIDHLHLELPPGAGQMLFENAIKHNTFSTLNPLWIRAYYKDQYLVIVNNIQPRIEEGVSSGIGLQNTKRRYSHFTDLPVEIVESEEYFLVRLPLIKIEPI